MEKVMEFEELKRVRILLEAEIFYLKRSLSSLHLYPID